MHYRSNLYYVTLKLTIYTDNYKTHLGNTMKY